MTFYNALFLPADEIQKVFSPKALVKKKEIDSEQRFDKWQSVVLEYRAGEISRQGMQYEIVHRDRIIIKE